MNSSYINHSCFSAPTQLICLPVFPLPFHQTHTFPAFSFFSCALLPLTFHHSIHVCCTPTHFTLMDSFLQPPSFSPSLYIKCWLASWSPWTPHKQMLIKSLQLVSQQVIPDTGNHCLDVYQDLQSATNRVFYRLCNPDSEESDECGQSRVHHPTVSISVSSSRFYQMHCTRFQRSWRAHSIWSLQPTPSLWKCQRPSCTCRKTVSPSPLR